LALRLAFLPPYTADDAGAELEKSEVSFGGFSDDDD
jgi:hypothetical protein